MPAVRDRHRSITARRSQRGAQVHLSERELAHLWEGQRFPPQALTTAAGPALRVIYRGRRGGASGPDYRDAVIHAPWGTLKGDVELHVRSSDFRRHGHHRDPAYNRVALHLVYWQDDAHDTVLASGRRVPVAALAPWMERRSEEIRRWLESPSLWEEPCHSANYKMGGDAVAAVLSRLGDIRFRRRTAVFRRALAHQDPDQVLYGALMEALGYGGNREAFLILAQRLPWREMRARLRAHPPHRHVGAALELLVEAARGPPALAWRTSGGRPGNHPSRRLEAAAHLAACHAETGLARGLASLLSDDVPAAVASLSVRDLGHSLVGPGRAVEMLTNAVLPFFAAGIEEQSARAKELYRALPRPATYGAVRHLDEALGRGIRVDARRQQGMLFLLRHYCSQGRCGNCPLSRQQTRNPVHGR